jgi:hypothetical protein
MGRKRPVAKILQYYREKTNFHKLFALKFLRDRKITQRKDAPITKRQAKLVWVFRDWISQKIGDPSSDLFLSTKKSPYDVIFNTVGHGAKVETAHRKICRANKATGRELRRGLRGGAVRYIFC